MINSTLAFTPSSKKFQEIPPTRLAELKSLSQYLVETESTLSAFWLLSPSLKMIAKDGVIIRASPSWETALGYSEEELKGVSYKDFIHPDDVDNTTDVEEIMAEGVVARHFKNRYRHKNHHDWVYLDWYARQDQYSGMVYATAIDITKQVAQQKQLEELLYNAKQEKQLLQAILERAPMGIFMADACGECTYINARYSELTGLSFEEAKGGGWKMAVCDTHREQLINDWYAYIESWTPESPPLVCESCYHNKKTNIITHVVITAYFFERSSTVGYIEVQSIHSAEASNVS